MSLLDPIQIGTASSLKATGVGVGVCQRHTHTNLGVGSGMCDTHIGAVPTECVRSLLELPVDD